MSAQCHATNQSENINDVLFEEEGDKGLIVLNRPRVLNALNLFMINSIYETMTRWQDTMSTVVLMGTGKRVFCAGGDVKSTALALNEPGGELHGQEVLRKQYRLDYLIGTYKKPSVAIIHGIVMGGGAGLSVHGKYRVASGQTMFAMPETAIGFSPDVGATYFLSRLQGSLGVFLGLTGYRLRGVDVWHTGIATHYVPFKMLNGLIEALLAPGTRDVMEILDEFHSESDCSKAFSLAPHVEKINEYFSADSVEEIVHRLKTDGSNWSKEVLGLLGKMSPTALKVAKAAIEKGRDLSLADCLKMEYRISCSFLTRDGDFYEGVRALLIDKDQKPVWNPESLEQVTDENVASFFSNVPSSGDLLL